MSVLVFPSPVTQGQVQFWSRRVVNCVTFPLASRKLEFTIGFGKFGKQTLTMGKLVFIWSFPVET